MFYSQCGPHSRRGFPTGNRSRRANPQPAGPGRCDPGDGEDNAWSMKFLILTVSLTSGGAERQLLFCGRTLVELGNEVTIITFRAGHPNERMRELKKSVEAAGVRILERQGSLAYREVNSYLRRNRQVIVWAWGLRCSLFAKLLTTPFKYRL